MRFLRNAKVLHGAAGLAALASVGVLTVGGTWAFFSASESSAATGSAASHASPLSPCTKRSSASTSLPERFDTVRNVSKARVRRPSPPDSMPG